MPLGGGGGWGRTTEINESTHAHFTKLLTIASMIALQVVRTSYVWEVASPQPPSPPPPPRILCLVVYLDFLVVKM